MRHRKILVSQYEQWPRKCNDVIVIKVEWSRKFSVVHDRTGSGNFRERTHEFNSQQCLGCVILRRYS